MVKNATQKEGGVVHADIQPDEAVSRMTESRMEKILILREERHTALTMQQPDDVRVFDAGTGDFMSDLAKRDAPLFESW